VGERLRVIVLGLMVRVPLGGMAWHHLQYAMGLHELGHDVFFAEDSNDYPWSCYDPSRFVSDADPSYGLRFATSTFDRVGLGTRWAYYDAHTARWLGPCADRIIGIAETADLLLDLGLANPMRPWFAGIRARALVDTDPVFTQIRHLTEPENGHRALEHTAFFTFGENIGRTISGIPDDGLPWLAARQPIALSAWKVTPPRQNGRFTTVMQWDSYQVREYRGVRYGMKSDSFDPYMELPDRTGSVFELALGGSTAPREALRSKGWLLRDPLKPTRDPWTYQRYIRGSKAEFSVAKHGYVISHSGWFSERSAAYLASGRPVVVQDTGFSEWLDAGLGVIPFRTPDEALAGIEDVNSRYAVHCRAARELADEYFDARKVLPPLLERAIESASAPRRAAQGSPT
jgi:hypothetical protein